MTKQQTVQNLKATLRAAGLTQSWAARQLRKSKAHMGEVFRGQIAPSEALTESIADLEARIRNAGLILSKD